MLLTKVIRQRKWNSWTEKETSFLLPIENASFFQHIAQIDVGIQKVGVQLNSLLKVMDGQPDFSEGIKHASQVAPSNSKFRSRLDRFQVASLWLGNKGRGYRES